MRIQVLFLEDVYPKYQAGDVHNVPGGYARNYLIPQGLATLATKDQLRRVAKIRSSSGVKRDAEINRLNSLGDRINGLTIPFESRAGGGGRLYGSVSTAQISEEIKRITGDEITRRSILLSEPIKELGTYQIQVQLGREFTGSITLVVHDGSPDATEVEDSVTDETELSEEIQGSVSNDKEPILTGTDTADEKVSSSQEEIIGEVAILDSEESFDAEEDEGENVRGESTSP